MDELLKMRVEPARDSGKKRAEDEREHLVFRGVDAHRFGGNLIVAYGEEAAAIGGIHETEDHVNGERGEGEGPKKIGMRLHAAKAALRAERLGVLDHAFDDFIEAERDDGEVIALQAQRRHADEQPGERGTDAAGGRRERRSWSYYFPSARIAEQQREIRRP